MSQPQDPNQPQYDQQAYQQAEYQDQYAQQQVAQEQAHEEELPPESSSNSSFLLFRAIPSWGVSLVLHTAILVILGLVILHQQANSQPSMVSSLSTDDLIDEIFEEEILEPIDTPVEVAQEVTPDLQMSLDPVEEVTDSEPVEVADDVEAAIADVELVEFGDKSIPDVNLTDSVSTVTGTGLAGRGSQSRSQMVKQYGGTKESEAAVAEALKWFARHQLPNGAWSFDHQKGQCQGRCGNPGRLGTSFNGATALAILPYLGAGQTHTEGNYKEIVERGLYFLTNSYKAEGIRGNWADPGGRLYTHGLCGIVLCEAYAMTNDKRLLNAAQMAINHIVYAQDPVGGGWRYQPRQAGDTSVVGWQLMALKSGHMAYLQVPKLTVAKASLFLDSVSLEEGAYYGYTTPGKRPATTAVGLLCCMYLGWKKNEPGLEKGVEYLSNHGPSKTDMYFNYYATQVLRHYGAEKWTKWNTEMRDWLVKEQSMADNHMKGSWMVGNGHGAGAGGRLYTTSMATMILEVYYRHMPIYKTQAAEDDFPL